MADEPKPKVPPDLIIQRTEFPKWWKNLATTPINLQTGGAQIIVPWHQGKPRYLLSLTFTVDGETDIYLRLGYVNITGPMSFGGEDEPRAIVMDFTSAPIPCGDEIMSIYSEPEDEPVQVSGLATYYTQPN